MASNRVERTNEDIKFVLSGLLRDIKDPRLQQGLLSIVSTKTTGDLRYCQVYVSALGDVDERELKRGLRSAAGYLRHELGERLSLRYTPELMFEIDHSIAQGAHIAKILNSLDTDTSSGENSNDDA